MNYLSHFVIDHKPQSPYYNSALIFPDITKRWIKTFNQPLPPQSFTYNQLQLLEGCKKHYQSDKTFHTSSFFEKYFGILNQRLKDVSFSTQVNRKWFIAHVLFELLIDRTFVKKYPELVDAFYNDLNAIADDELTPFLHYYGMTETKQFMNFFNHFRGVQYIYQYADNNKFLYSLSRIMMRVGISELGHDDGQKLLSIILQLEETIFAKPEALLLELKTVFNP